MNSNKQSRDWNYTSFLISTSKWLFDRKITKICSHGFNVEILNKPLTTTYKQRYYFMPLLFICPVNPKHTFVFWSKLSISLVVSFIVVSWNVKTRIGSRNVTVSSSWSTVNEPVKDAGGLHNLSTRVLVGFPCAEIYNEVEYFIIFSKSIKYNSLKILLESLENIGFVLWPPLFFLMEWLKLFPKDTYFESTVLITSWSARWFWKFWNWRFSAKKVIIKHVKW